MFTLPQKEKDIFTLIIRDFYIRMQHLSESDASRKSLSDINLLIKGLTKEGEIYPDDIPFAERVSKLTKGFYTPTKSDLRKTFLPVAPKRKKDDTTVSLGLTGTKTSDELYISKFKKEIFNQYPFLFNRKDLESSIESYAALDLKIKKEIASSNSSPINIKNLVDAKLKLGSDLGVSEAVRAKKRESESKDNIATLSMQFEETMSQWPKLGLEIKLYELKMLLQKYERRELSREIFALNIYADMTVEEAYAFIDNHEKKFDN